MIIDGLNDPISKLFLERINNPLNESDLEVSNKYNLYIQWGYTPTLAIGALSGNYELKAPASKKYSPSVWGAIDNFIDKLTTNSEILHSGPEVRPTPKSYFASGFKKAKDPARYWHPILGANERWKTSMDNRTNPLTGIRDVVLPSVLGAATVTYGPELVAKGALKAVEIAPKVVQTIARHPKLSALVAKSGTLNLGSSLVKGYLGAEAVNGITMLGANKSFSEWLAPYLGVSKGVADFLNPGYLLGGYKTGILKSIRDTKNIRAFKDRALDILKNKEEIYNKATEVVRAAELKASKAILEWLDAYYGKYSTFYPIIWDPKYRQYIKNDRVAIREMAFGKEPPVENLSFYLHLPETYLTTDGLGNKLAFNFTDELGSTLSSNFLVHQSKGTAKAIDLTIKYNPLTGFKDESFVVKQLGPLGFNVIEPLDDNTRKSITSYVDRLNSRMGEDGVVAGSLVGYRDGFIKGTPTPNGLIGPADTEIYTTAKRLPNLLRRLLFNLTSTNSVGGRKGTSPFTFRNNDSAHNGLDTEINIIQENEQGQAVGNIAHQIYRALFPKEYDQLVRKQAYSISTPGEVPNLFDLPLPVSAEDLLQLVRNPDNMRKHLISDLLGLETFTRTLNLKAQKRLYSALFDPESSSYIKEGQLILGEHNLGAGFKSATEQFPNLDLSDLKTNTLFLTLIYGLSEEEATALASNPTVMENAINRYVWENSTGVRMVGNDVVGDVTLSGLRYHNPDIEFALGNGAFSGGTWSGPGLNTMLLNPYGGWHPGKGRGNWGMLLVVTQQRPITYFPDKIKTPMDIVSLVEHLKTHRPAGLYAENLAMFDPSKKVPVKYDTLRMKEISELSKQEDLPIWLQDGYAGGLAEPLAFLPRVIGMLGQGHAELGSLFRNLKGRGNSNIMELPEFLDSGGLPILDKLKAEGDKQYNILKNLWPSLSPLERYRLGSINPLGIENVHINLPTSGSVRVNLTSKTKDFELETISHKLSKVTSRIRNLEDAAFWKDPATFANSLLGKELQVLKQRRAILQNRLRERFKQVKEERTAFYRSRNNVKKAKKKAVQTDSELKTVKLLRDEAAKDYYNTNYRSTKYNHTGYFENLPTLSSPLLPFAGIFAGLSLLGHNKFKEPDYGEPEWNPNLDGIWLPEVEIALN